MNGWLGLIQQALFFGAVVVIVTACATALVYPLVHSKLRALGAATQANCVLVLGVLPLLMTAAVLASALLPSLLQLLGIGADHCVGHEGGHQHFCLVHRPIALDGSPLLAVGMIFIALPVSIAWRIAVDLVRTHAFLRSLTRYDACVSGKVQVFATETPLAFSSGIFRQRIFLSTGLLESLSNAEIAALTAHETAHLARHDSLRLLLARALSLAHLPSTRRALLAHLQLASEQACDAIAAAQTRDANLVAALLCKIERMYRLHFPRQAPLASSVLGESANTLPVRVHALLAPPVAERFRWMPAAASLMVALLLLIGHNLLHDSLEHVFNLFTHE